MRGISRRTLITALLIWALASMISAVCVRRAWRSIAPGADSPGLAAKAISNFTQTAALPLWLANWRYHVVSTNTWRGALAISAGGWGAWTVLVLTTVSVLGSRRPRNADAGPPVSPSRRRFFADAAAAGVGVGLIGTPARAALVNPWSLAVRRYRVPIRDLPAGLDGLRIVFIADTHLGAWVPESYLNEVIVQARELAPDIYCLGGDYIHMGAANIHRGTAIFRPLVDDPRAAGVLAVLGNHDHYGGGTAIATALRSQGVNVIDNDRVFLDAPSRTLRAEPTDACLCVAGLGDLWTDVVDPQRAFRGVGSGTPRIALAHNPDTAEVLSQRGSNPPRIDLMLSGHMHGGQVNLPVIGAPWVPSRFGQKYARGLVESPVGPVIVSAGVGLSGVPVRVGVPPELVEVTLVRA